MSEKTTDAAIDAIISMVTTNRSPKMEFAYVDESGDTGMKDGTATFSLGCVLVPVDFWDERLKFLVRMRRDLSRSYGVRMRDEVKANWIVGGRGTFDKLKLGDGQLRDVYQRHIRAITIVASGAFAIVVDKQKILKRDIDVFDHAWTYLLERLRKRSESSGVPIVLIHDHGEDARVQTLFRRFRRVNWDYNHNMVEAPLLVEDPVSRDSKQSYFIQLADLAAYAGASKALAPRGRRAKICSGEMWDLLDATRVAAVSTRRHDGLYVWPT